MYKSHSLILSKSMPIKMTESQKDVLSALKQRVIEAQKTTPGPHIAAFDADGTLWKTDLGEVFFDYQINHCGLRLPENPWQFYHDEKIRDTRAAYLWLAQINAGERLDQVKAWAEAAYTKEEPFPIFDFQRELIDFLHERQFEVYVVTASVKWAVEPGAKRLGIPDTRVLGITTEVVNGVVTEKQAGPITWKEGKPEAILQATGGKKPLLAAGNTPGDSFLLSIASDVALAVTSESPSEPLYLQEAQLQDEAKLKGWTSLRL